MKYMPAGGITELIILFHFQCTERTNIMEKSILNLEMQRSALFDLDSGSIPELTLNASRIPSAIYEAIIISVFVVSSSLKLPL